MKLVSPFSSFFLVGFGSRTIVEAFVVDHSFYSGIYPEKEREKKKKFKRGGPEPAALGS